MGNFGLLKHEAKNDPVTTSTGRTRRQAFISKYITLFYDDLDLWVSGRQVLHGSSADLVDAAMLFSPRFFYPYLLSRHHYFYSYFINARKSVPPPQYCNAVKDRVQT